MEQQERSLVIPIQNKPLENASTKHEKFSVLFRNLKAAWLEGMLNFGKKGTANILRVRRSFEGLSERELSKEKIDATGVDFMTLGVSGRLTQISTTTL